jgi:hypothetical protein
LEPARARRVPPARPGVEDLWPEGPKLRAVPQVAPLSSLMRKVSRPALGASVSTQAATTRSRKVASCGYQEVTAPRRIEGSMACAELKRLNRTSPKASVLRKRSPAWPFGRSAAETKCGAAIVSPAASASWGSGASGAAGSASTATSTTRRAMRLCARRRSGR